MASKELFERLVESQCSPDKARENLERALSEFLSFSKGVEVVKTATGDSPGRITAGIPVADLLLYSLVDELPEGFDPYSGDFKLAYNSGCSFRVKGKFRRSDFAEPFRTFMDTYVLIGTKPMEQLLYESGFACEALNKKQREELRAQALSKLKNAKGKKFAVDFDSGLEVEIGETTDDMLASEVAANDLEGRPIRMKSEFFRSLVDGPMASGDVLFLKNAMFVFNPESGNLTLQRYKRSVEKYIARRVSKLLASQVDHFTEKRQRVLREAFSDVMRRVLRAKSDDVPLEQRSSVDQQAAGLLSKFGVYVPVRTFDSKFFTLAPRYTSEELETLGRVFDFCTPFKGFDYSEAFRANSTDFDGSPSAAILEMKRAALVLYSEGSVPAKDNELRVTDAALVALRENFWQGIQFIFSRDARRLFADIPKEAVALYADITKQDLKREYDKKAVVDAVFGRQLDTVLLRDFINSAFEYRLAAVEQRPARLDESRRSFLSQYFTEHPPSSGLLLEGAKGPNSLPYIK